MVLQDNELTVVEQQAFNLAQAAIQLDQSRGESRDMARLAQALEHNLQVWVEIGTLVKSPESRLAENVRDNILKLRDFALEKAIDLTVLDRQATLQVSMEIENKDFYNKVNYSGGTWRNTPVFVPWRKKRHAHP